MTQYRQVISMYTRSKCSDTGSLFRQFNKLMHTKIIHMTFTYMPKEVYLKNVCRPFKIEFE